jgi:serine/threonine-protein kinase PknG
VNCRRAGCPGSYGPEGYCNECGRRMPAGAPAPREAGDDSKVLTPDLTPVGAAVPADAWAGVNAALGATGASTAASAPGTDGSPTHGATPSGPSTQSAGSPGAGRPSTGRRTPSRGRLGAGLIDIPRIPRRDPASAVLAEPVVPEKRRFCARCDSPVGRTRGGQQGLTTGFCPNCRSPYSFLPRLSPGDVLSGRYEVLGCLAHGGLGWIYLARDRHVSDKVADRWVVLKGLIDTGDPDAMAAAVNERRFLVNVDHSTIVKIHDFASHPDPRTGTDVGYIVMEYVGGPSLRDLLLAHRESTGQALPLAHVLAYGLEVLPALGYLHDRDLLYCDFKPDNVIHADDQLKLIDLGAVRQADDMHSAVYGTPGYQAPEVASVGPSVASDVYTVGRAMAVLSFGFRGFSTTYVDRLPDRGEVRLLASEESFDRLLRRATHLDPRRRFGSTAEMAEQVRGVLREVLSAADGTPRPEPSAQFTRERRVFGTEAGLLAGDTGDAGGPAGSLAGATIAAALPLPLPDASDPGVGYLATVATTDPDELVAILSAAPVRTMEVGLRLVRARIEQGDPAGALADLDSAGGFADWRLDWYRGLAALAAERWTDARAAFDAVYSELPGEPAARVALAVACERDGDPAAAEPRYERVWAVDRDFVSAAFGLARLRLARGDRVGCVEVLDQVPDSSSQYHTAQVAAVRARVGAELAHVLETDLLDASSRLERLRLGVERNAWLAAEMLERSLLWVRVAQASLGARVLGHELSERSLRLGLEQAYRALAKMAPDPESRIGWVDRANSVRPRTWV